MGVSVLVVGGGGGFDGVGVLGGCHWIAEHLVSFDEF